MCILIEPGFIIFERKKISSIVYKNNALGMSYHKTCVLEECRNIFFLVNKGEN